MMIVIKRAHENGNMKYTPGCSVLLASVESCGAAYNFPECSYQTAFAVNTFGLDPCSISIQQTGVLQAQPGSLLMKMPDRIITDTDKFDV